MSETTVQDFKHVALSLAGAQNSAPWLDALRFTGTEQWLEALWPNRRTELWKYTPLTSLQRGQFASWGSAQAYTLADDTLLTMAAIRLVFVNGEFDAQASTGEAPEVVRFSKANAAQQAVIEAHLGKIVDIKRHLFASLSNAWTQDGVLVHVPKNGKLDLPVYVVHISTPEADPAIANQRVLVVLEESAQAELIEHFVSDERQQNGFVNSLTEIQVGANAQFSHYRMNLEEEHLIHIGGVHINLASNAQYLGFTLAEGSQLKRIDYQICHKGKGAHAGLNGVYLPRNKHLLDYHTNVEHEAPHCTTSEVFRGIIADSAKAVFNGRIHIHPDAQKTLAELSNKNLLTSDRAEVDTKPELEIYADDVKCAHGATVSQLDLDSMFYLQSRGLSEKQARTMLSFGFINELLQGLPEQAVRDHLHRHLSIMFAKEQFS